MAGERARSSSQLVIENEEEMLFMESSTTGCLFLYYILSFHFKGNGSYSKNDSLTRCCQKCGFASYLLCWLFITAWFKCLVPDKTTDVKEEVYSRGWAKKLIVEHQYCVPAVRSSSSMADLTWNSTEKYVLGGSIHTTSCADFPRDLEFSISAKQRELYQAQRPARYMLSPCSLLNVFLPVAQPVCDDVCFPALHSSSQIQTQSWGDLSLVLTEGKGAEKGGCKKCEEEMFFQFPSFLCLTVRQNDSETRERADQGSKIQ